MYKKITALLLTAVLLLGLTGCAEGRSEASAADTPAPASSAVPLPAADSPAPTAELPAETIPAVTVEIRRESQVYTDESAGITLLDFSAALPVVKAPAYPAAEEAVNRELARDYDLFVNGTEEWEGISGREEYLKAAKEEYAMRVADGYEEYYAPYQLRRDAWVSRGDSRVLSIVLSETTYTGGAHGYHCLSGKNFDTVTGKLLSLEDLAEDPQAFLADCADRLWEVSQDSEHAVYALGGYFPDYEEYLPGLIRDGNWYFDDEGIVVIANPYEVAPYAAGLITFTLPYEWLRWHMREEYLPEETAAEGELAGDIDAASGADYLVDDNTDGQGALVRFTARGRVKDVKISYVTYAEYNNSFYEDGTLFFASSLADGETLAVRTWIPDVLPTLQISYTAAEGERKYLISQSGKDGSLVLMDALPYAAFPVEISKKLPYACDLDGDYDLETVDLVRSGSDGTHWNLTVDGKAAGDVFAMDAQLSRLWIADLDGDGAAEIIFSGDMGSDDYVTCAWRADTLEPIQFTGESRRGADPEELTRTADGLAVFSLGGFYLESWSYQLGTYRAVREYELKDGVIAPGQWSDWAYCGNRFDLTVKKDLPVVMDDGGETVLSPGDVIRLLGTDGSTVRFVRSDGASGTLRLSMSEDGGWTIDGIGEDAYFEILPYVG